MTPDEPISTLPSPPPEPEPGDDYCNYTTPAKHLHGVLYQGPWETLDDGSCRAVRMQARALGTTGIPVLLKSFNHSVRVQGVAISVFETDIDALVRKEVLHLTEASIAELGPRIFHLVPRSAESLRQLMVPRSVLDEDVARLASLREQLMRSSIIYSVWERDRIPEEIARVMSRTGSCWVPCTQNAQALELSGVPDRLIQVVPHPFDPGSRLAQEGPRRPVQAGKRFLAIGLWQPRKALHEALGAFLRTFEPDEASFTVKTTPMAWPGYPTPQESLRMWVSDDRVRAKGWTMASLKGRVRLILSRLSDAEITELHFASNIFLSPSHGEAWGLGAFEAKIAGNRLVHVSWGGTSDFAGSGDVAIPYRLGPVPRSYRWDEGTMWADYEIEALEEALRTVVPPHTHDRDGSFDVNFSLDAVGRKMARLVLLVADETSPDTARYLREQWR